MIRRVKLPAIAFIVARSHRGHVIGKDNKLPWRLRSDLRRFRRLTLDHAVIMGRKTLDSIGHPLDRRLNIVTTKRVNQDIFLDNVIRVGNVESALFWADHYSILHDRSEFFVMGGEGAFSMFEGLYYKIYLTEVFCGEIEGDAYFRTKFDRRKWNLVEEIDHPSGENDEFPFRYLTFELKRQFKRMRDWHDFVRGYEQREQWISEAELKVVERYVEEHTEDSTAVQAELSLPEVRRRETN